jgi:diketogulonate reductase-like aldo/keto reductase
MTKAPLVQANGAAIPALGLGTWRLSGEACVEAIGWALEAGYRHIDTAAMYDNEEAVGAGIRASGLARDDIFLTTKVWHDDLAPGDLERAAEASLKRLKLEQVDLLLIHWPNLGIPLRGTMEALCRVKRQGLARHIGVANFTVGLLDEAVRLASEPLVTNQCEYHPYLDQTPVLAACRRHGLSLTSYCPLGRTTVFSERAVRDVAAAHRKTPAQVVLRWHVQQPGVVAIPKSADRKRIAENIAIFDFALTAEEMRRISALTRRNERMVAPSWSPRWDTAA